MRLPVAGRARAVVVLLGWVAAAAVGGVIAVTAIEAVGQGLVGSSTTPLSADQVDEALAEQTARATPTTSASPTQSAGTSTPPSSGPPTSVPPTTQPPAGGESKLLSTPGGSIVARCDGANPVIMSTTPTQGFQAERDDDEGEGRARVDFESDDGRVRVEIFCTDGVPDFTIDD